MGMRLWIAAVGAAAVVFAASAAQADVTVQHRFSIEGVGLMSAANMSGTTRTAISADRSRTDSDIQLQSRLMRMLAHRAVGPTAEIIRLDAGKIDRLDLSRKQYSEITFDEMKARAQKAIDKSPSGQEGPKPMDDSKCEWLDPKVDVRRTGEKATYAGFQSERLTIVASQPCKDKETGSICEVALALDDWLAPQYTAGAEVNRFQRAYLEKIGVDLPAIRRALGGGDIRERAQAMFGRYAGIWDEIVSKTRDIKGYPVKTSFAFGVGGTQCKNPSAHQQNSDSDDWSRGSSDVPSGDSGASDSSSTSGGLTGQVAGKLGALFHHKKDDAGVAQTPPATILPDGLVPLVTLTSEVMSVSSDSVGADLFEVPKDFKRIDRQGD
jgi:hypothetical protein